MNEKTVRILESASAIAFGALAIAIIVLAIFGGVISYSPVPFWDMWNGYIGFFLKASQGDTSVWWSQHNEHRILLARLLFWADNKWFGGTGWFLIGFNYLLVCMNALVFWRMLRDASPTALSPQHELFLGGILTAWLFLWCQEDNLVWAFQSQFFLAQLLPLCALYWLHKSVTGPNCHIHFFVSCCFGLASIGTMANGILALPLMFGYALMTKQQTSRIYILASLSVATWLLYFYGYHAQHGLLLRTISENPLGLIRYILLYLGNPFFYLLGKGAYLWRPTFYLTSLAGLSLIGYTAWLSITLFRKPRDATLKLALLFFMFYIIGSAIATASGRLIFGEHQALSGRYTTPVLMAWATLAVIASPTILLGIKTQANKYLPPFALLGLLMLLFQSHALKSPDDIKFQRKIAALVLELQVRDLSETKNIYPDNLYDSGIPQKASSKNLSIFGIYPYIDLREQLGHVAQQIKQPACQGHLDTVKTIPEDDRFVRIKGWMMNPSDKTYPELIRLLDQQGKMVGFALTGEPRPDISKIFGDQAMLAGYQGYLLMDQTGIELTLQGDTSCQMQVKPDLPVDQNHSTKMPQTFHKT